MFCENFFLSKTKGLICGHAVLSRTYGLRFLFSGSSLKHAASAFPRVLLGLSLLAFLLWWSVAQFRFHSMMGKLDATLRSGEPEKIAALVPPFPLAAEETKYGEFMMNTVFPPQLKTAESAFHRSLVLDPLSSRTWMGLAEVFLYQGKTDQANQALTMSDALDPNYPRERLESIRLWVLLGNREKAINHGARIASLGGNNPRLAVEQLVQSGIPLEEVAQATNWPELSPSELNQVMRWFRESRPKQYAEAVSLLPAESLKDQPFLQQVARMAVELQAVPLALEIWQKSALPPTLISPRIALPEPEFAQSPFRDGFPLGWRNPDETKMKLRWRQSLAAEGGNFKQLAQDGPGLVWEWQVQPNERSVIEVGRVLLLAGEQDSLTAFLEVQGIREGKIELELAPAKGYINSPAQSIIPGVPQELTLTIPPSQEPQIVRLSLIVRPKTLDPDARRVRLLLRRFSSKYSEEAK